MRYKKIGCLISLVVLILSLVFFLPVGMSAMTADEIIDQQKEEYGWSDLEKAVPEEVYENSKDFNSDFSIENVEQFLNIKGVLSYIGKVFVNLFTQNGSFLYGLLAILVIAVFIKILSDGNLNSNVSKILNTAVVLSSAVLLFKGIFDSAGTVSSSVETMSSFSSSMLPVSSALIAASGRPAFSAAYSTIILFAVQFFSAVLAAFIVPCTNVYLAMGVGAGLSDNSGLKKFAGFIKNSIIIILSFIYCLFTGIMSLQSLFTSAGDSLAKQAIKFAAGSFIPVAGSYLGEGVETVYSCASGLKNTSGAFGIAVIFFITAVPVIGLLCKLAMLKLAEVVCDMFGNTVLSSFFSIAKDVFTILFSILLGYTIMLILMLSIMMQSG